jgi:hypothetical protein
LAESAFDLDRAKDKFPDIRFHFTNEF